MGVSLIVIVLVAAVWWREELVYNVRLINAARMGAEYYDTYPHITKNIAYGAEPHQLLDVYTPDTPGDYPVVIYIQGGGWNSGNKELYALVAQKLVPHGMVVVVPKYALYPDATYPQMVADVASVVAWSNQHIAEYGGNPQRIVLGGQSAGAQLSAMALLDDQQLRTAGVDAAVVCGYYGISGVYDIAAQYAYEQSFGRTAPVMTAVMGGPTAFAATSPVSAIRPGLPPMLLVHGDADETVPMQMTLDFATALRQAGVEVTPIIYPERGHSELLFYTIMQDPGQMILDMAEFVARSCVAPA
jgi:acetyl esterase/lipase